MLLQVRSLSKSYGALPVLSEITFALNAAERAGVVGANGAGKSTLLRILVGRRGRRYWLGRLRGRTSTLAICRRRSQTSRDSASAT